MSVSKIDVYSKCVLLFNYFKSIDLRIDTYADMQDAWRT
jgi:hypothetical protein